MAGIPQAKAFQVSALNDDQSIEVWEQHNADALIGLACRIPSDTTFRATEINLQLERLHLAFVRGTPHTVVRDRLIVSHRPSDSVLVYAALRGEALWEHSGGRTVVRPGQLLVCDGDRPFLRGFGHGVEELAVKVPRDALAEVTGMSSIEMPLLIDGTGDKASPYARALVRLVGRSVGRAAIPADERTILELVSVVATGGRVGLPVAHRAAARAFIDDHLVDPAMSAADVAAGAGISERHLSRLFAATGMSVPQHILARRLDLAYSLLGRADLRDIRLSEIAGKCGLTSTAHFSEAFKRRFDKTPGAVRRDALTS